MTVDTVDTETGARCEVCILLVLIGGVILCVVTTRAGEKGLELKTKVRKDFTIIEKVPTVPFLGWTPYLRFHIEDTMHLNMVFIVS